MTENYDLDRNYPDFTRVSPELDPLVLCPLLFKLGSVQPLTIYILTMEFLRRLRIIWTVACYFAAVAVGIAYLGNPNGVPLAWLFAALAAGSAPHLNGSLMLRLSVFWLVGVGMFVLGAFIMSYDPQYGGASPLIKTAAVIGGSWVTAAVLTWLFGGLKKQKNPS